MVREEGGKGASAEMQHLTQWLRKCFVQQAGKPESIELCQLTQKGASRVFIWTIAEQEEEARSPDAFAEQILDFAEEDARTMRGVQRYLVRVYLEERSEPLARRQFTMRGGMLEDDGTFSETEEANTQGLISQQMRHNEALLRLAVSSHLQSSNRDARIIDKLLESNEKLQAQQLEVIDLVQDLKDRKATREREDREAERSSERKDRIVSTLEPLVPIALMKLLPSAGGAAVGKQEATKKFLTSLDGEQIGAIMAALTEEQRIGLQAVIASMMQDEEAKEAKK